MFKRVLNITLRLVLLSGVFRNLPNIYGGTFFSKAVHCFCKLASSQMFYTTLDTQKQPNLRPAALLKKRFQHRCFPLNFVKFLRTSFLLNTSAQLLLDTLLLLITVPNPSYPALKKYENLTHILFTLLQNSSNILS